MTRYGIEVEFASHRNWREIPTSTYWRVGTDQSARRDGFCSGIELRSDVFESEWADEVFDELHGILLRLRSCSRAHNQCGVHIHFSRPFFSRPFLANLRRELDSRYGKSIKKARERYCNSHSGRYVPLRRVEMGHFEVRVFNGTMNTRAIRRYWEFLHNFIENPENHLRSQ